MNKEKKEKKDFHKGNDDIEELHNQLNLIAINKIKDIQKEYKDFIIVRFIIYSTTTVGFLISFISFLLYISYFILFIEIAISLTFLFFTIIFEINFKRKILNKFKIYEIRESIKPQQLNLKMYQFFLLLTLILFFLIFLTIPLIGINPFIVTFIIIISVLYILFDSKGTK